MANLDKQYNPQPVEKKWKQFWEETSVFKAQNETTKPIFSLSIPPPNVTGVLHMGHALVNTLQDVLVRYKRMCGFETLWVPGTDHAGIATQTVVERHLIKTEGKRRTDFSREEFHRIVWEWKERSERQILHQLMHLGCSCDWTRLAFTMDEARSRAVRTLFKKMFDEGLIYRGDYLVHWDPVTQTALADDEVEYEERKTYLWYIRYPIEGESGSLMIATTRPETMLGDVALAVSPSDDRYANLIGKRARLPLVNRSLPIIADRFVDPRFGTGVVKITPAHDPNDYETALRHELPLVNILTKDGRINEKGGEFAGLPTEEARTQIVKALKAKGWFVRAEPYVHRVGVSYRSKAIIEPFLSKQWFVRMQPFKERLKKAIAEKHVRLIPAHWEATYFHWIDHLRDWCISRQLWWGHRIPIWYNKADPNQILCHDGEHPPEQVQKHPDDWIQDEDVLDTWFSSALWPFSALGWPQESKDLKTFFPNSVLVTGHDILFFWVARMIMMSEYLFGKPPFPEVFLHGLIYGKSYWRIQKDGTIHFLSAKEREPYDLGTTLPPEIHGKWEKMSKSKGNIIDPLEMMEIYGTDALRLGLCASATHVQQIDLDRRRFEEFRNFINKIWNGARFVLLNIEDLSPEVFASGIPLSSLTLEDHWILSRLNRTIREVHISMQKYAFDAATLDIYHFFWDEFCAYYIELVKPILFGKTGTNEMRANKQIILCVLFIASIRLLHPMAPFITEELFATIKTQLSHAPRNSSADAYTQETLLALNSTCCATAPYPQVLRPEDIDKTCDETFDFLGKCIRTIRQIRTDMQIPPGSSTDLFVVASHDNPQRQLLESHTNILSTLVRLQNITFVEKEIEGPFAAPARVENLTLIIPLPEELREKEYARLTKQREKLVATQNQLRTQLANTGFLEKAPPPIVAKLQTTLEQTEKELITISQKLASLFT